MEVGELISFFRKQSGMTIDELAAKSGVPKGTLNKIIGGVTKAPTLDNMKSIAKALGKTLADFDDIPTAAKKPQNIAEATPGKLSAEEQAHIKKYRSLDPYGKEAVDGVLDVEYRRCTAEAAAKTEPPKEAACVVLPFFRQPSSAGPGQPFNDERSEEIRMKKDPPKGTSYITVVSGRSMEPTYNDGDLIFVCGIPEIRKGQIGIFSMDGQQYVKELGDGVLLSHNPAYGPRPMTDDIRCQGLVLGVCDESYFD